MLTIRDRQMRAFRRIGQQELVTRLTRHVRFLYPEKLQAASDQAVAEWIYSGIERATEYGLRTEYDIARFVEFQAYLGPEFDITELWAAKILRSDGLPGTKKMNRLDQIAQERFRLSAKSDHDR